MASTNKTTHYELSQFLGTDKPAWLTDYNADMSKIDTGINTAQTTATGADGKADSANTAIGTLTNLTTDVKTDLVSAINEVDGHADTAQGTANNALSAANTANGDITTLKNYLNLDVIDTYTNSTTHALTTSTGSLVNGLCNITIARNSGGTLAKIYGRLGHTPTSTGEQVIKLDFDTGLRPDTDITITPAGFSLNGSSVFPTEFNVKIKTTGFVEITYWAGGLGSPYYYGILFPCLYIVKDFGDIEPNV